MLRRFIDVHWGWCRINFLYVDILEMLFPHLLRWLLCVEGCNTLTVDALLGQKVERIGCQIGVKNFLVNFLLFFWQVVDFVTVLTALDRHLHFQARMGQSAVLSIALSSSAWQFLDGIRDLDC